jgi:hypothetical protein
VEEIDYGRAAVGASLQWQPDKLSRGRSSRARPASRCGAAPTPAVPPCCRAGKPLGEQGSGARGWWTGGAWRPNPGEAVTGQRGPTLGGWALPMPRRGSRVRGSWDHLMNGDKLVVAVFFSRGDLFGLFSIGSGLYKSCHV